MTCSPNNFVVLPPDPLLPRLCLHLPGKQRLKRIGGGIGFCQLIYLSYNL